MKFEVHRLTMDDEIGIRDALIQCRKDLDQRMRRALELDALDLAECCRKALARQEMPERLFNIRSGSLCLVRLPSGMPFGEFQQRLQFLAAEWDYERG